jgi:hypothetical protein
VVRKWQKGKKGEEVGFEVDEVKTQEQPMFTSVVASLLLRFCRAGDARVLLPLCPSTAMMMTLFLSTVDICTSSMSACFQGKESSASRHDLT